MQSRRDVTKEDLDDPELVATLAALSVWTDNQPYPSDFRALEPHISLGPVQEASKGLEIFKDAGRPVDEGEKMAGMKSPLLLAQVSLQWMFIRICRYELSADRFGYLSDHRCG